jgi:hypothetical protein
MINDHLINSLTLNHSMEIAQDRPLILCEAKQGDEPFVQNRKGL